MPVNPNTRPGEPRSQFMMCNNCVKDAAEADADNRVWIVDNRRCQCIFLHDAEEVPNDPPTDRV